MKRTRSTELFPGAGRFRPCGKCEGGLVRVNSDGSRWNLRQSPAGTRLEPCGCRLAWKRGNATTGLDFKTTAAGE